MPNDDRRLRARKRPQQVRAELTRQRILGAAAQVFAQHGYAAGTTNRIAEQARVSVGSVYQYFPNKDAILLDLLTRHLDDGIASAWSDTGQGPPAPLEEMVRGLVRSSIDNHLDDPALLRVMVEQAPRSRELLDRMAEREAVRVRWLSDLLARHPEATVHDTDTAARLVLTTVEYATHTLVAEPAPVAVDRLETELIAMLTSYLGGRDQPPSLQ